jgi:hypothetical protein
MAIPPPVDGPAGIAVSVHATRPRQNPCPHTGQEEAVREIDMSHRQQLAPRPPPLSHSENCTNRHHVRIMTTGRRAISQALCFTESDWFARRTCSSSLPFADTVITRCRSTESDRRRTRSASSSFQRLPDKEAERRRLHLRLGTGSGLRSSLQCSLDIIYL